jgi:FkbM family methyltransferase
VGLDDEPVSVTFSFKQFLLTQPAGLAALRFRDSCRMLQSAWLAAEDLTTIASDQMATRLLISLCLPQKTFVDVGAHIGSIIAAVRHEVPSAHLVAIEAMPEKVEALRRCFPRVEIHHCAAADEEGETEFFIDTQATGFSSLNRPDRQTGSAVRQIHVPMKRLDDLLGTHDVDVMKIDVEGAELRVLRGAEKVLSRCRPLVMFESGWPGLDGPWSSVSGLFEFFDTRGYAIILPSRLAHTAPGLSYQGFRDSHWYPQMTTNYFAVPEERCVEFRDRARKILGLRLGSGPFPSSTIAADRPAAATIASSL